MGGSSNFDIIALIVVYVVIVITLGTLLDSISIILIVLPLFNQFNVNLVWLGILSIIIVEVGLLTPPLSIAVFVVKGCLPDEKISLKNIFWGTMPFGLIMLLWAS